MFLIQTKRFALLFAALLALVALGTIPAHAQGSGNPGHRVVIQVSSGNPTTQAVALHNAANLRKALGADNVQIEIVAYGPGIKLLTPKGPAPKSIGKLSGEGVRLSACHNTMAAIKRKTGHMPKLVDGVTVVPSGVARVVQLEEKGYTYVRP